MHHQVYHRICDQIPQKISSVVPQRSSLDLLTLLLRLGKNLGSCEDAIPPVLDEAVTGQHFGDDVGAVVGEGFGAHGGTLRGEQIGDSIDADHRFGCDGGTIADFHGLGSGIVEDHILILDERIACLIAGVDNGDDDALAVLADEVAIGESKPDGGGVSSGGTRSGDGCLDGLSTLGEDNIGGGHLCDDWGTDTALHNGGVEQDFVELGAAHPLGCTEADKHLGGRYLRHAADEIHFGTLVDLTDGFGVSDLGLVSATIGLALSALTEDYVTDFSTDGADKTYKFSHCFMCLGVNIMAILLQLCCTIYAT